MPQRKRPIKLLIISLVAMPFFLIIYGFLFFGLKLVTGPQQPSVNILEARADQEATGSSNQSIAREANLPEKIANLHNLWGISVAEDRRLRNSDENKEGKVAEKWVVVSQVLMDSLGAKMGLKKGDEIVAIDQKRVTSLKDYFNILERIEGNNRTLFYIRRGHDEFQLSIRLQQPGS